ncbi:LuxR C-terminal-related transcriptional regulator [Aquimarina hainanensis]|uniref:LuxR C-terminal-related transcriptional regulator n=1 Tax=Aquimarina hainanensis TaxID=1578017 RepID=A0ABW5NDE7_9FLAO|nr:LuxR C-terminal-related transcriptional regulator [Aquimarina sp. TRL1]QKX06442.1 hypothetical protein HN014_16490 [Aquimarina sp. TRL1]
MDDLQKIMQEYYTVLDQQKFVEDTLDYSIFENQIPFLDQMAKVNNSGITVFDLFQKRHIYSSRNLQDIFGYDTEKVKDTTNEYSNSRIHPDDLMQLTAHGIALLKFMYSIAPEKRKDYKLQNEYRVLNHENQYVRVIEQHMVLELDTLNNFWLALNVMDVSPNQESYPGIKSQLINSKTGEVSSVKEQFLKNNTTDLLSKRESEILILVKEGFLSKEISNNLSISIHTVNTHRQKILKKLGANNSFEAVEYASRLGLV